MYKSYYLFTEEKGCLERLFITKEEFIRKMEENECSLIGYDIETGVSQKVSEITETITCGNILGIFGEHHLVNSDEEDNLSFMEDDIINHIEEVIVYQKHDLYIKYYENRRCVKIILNC